MERSCRVKASRKPSRPNFSMGDDNNLRINFGGSSAPELDRDVRELGASDTSICNSNGKKIVTTGGDGIDYQKCGDKYFITFDREGGEGEDGDGDEADDLYSYDSNSDSDSDKSQPEESGSFGKVSAAILTLKFRGAKVAAAATSW